MALIYVVIARWLFIFIAMNFIDALFWLFCRRRPTLDDFTTNVLVASIWTFLLTLLVKS
jgi:hypothetical protein